MIPKIKIQQSLPATLCLMRQAGISPLLIFILLFVGSCRERIVPPDVPPYIHPIKLTNEDVSCTDAFVRIKTTKVFESGTLQLKRDGITRFEISNLKSEIDTLILDEGLLPNRTYKYTAYRVESGVLVDSSEDLKIISMDTTSHNFNFEIFYLGDGNSSVLYDVAVLSDTLAYAVGEIYKRDSTGQFNTDPYNFLKWNGKEWEMKSITYVALRAIFAFSKNDIWVGSTVMRHWNGSTWTTWGTAQGFPGGFWINKIWGTSSSNLYVCGTNGSIAHFNGVSWRRLESGTTLNIRHVFGAKDKRTGGYEILCVADGYGTAEGSKVLSIKNNVVYQIWHDPRPYGLDAIWFVPGRIYIVVGSGVWSTHLPETSWIVDTSLPMLHSTSVDGQNFNDIVVGGAYWLLAHWNGVNWQTYLPMTSGSFTSVQIHDNLIIAVGGSGNKAVVLRGTR